MDKWFKISGWQGSVSQEEIPVLPYADFFQQLCRALERESCHIASYFGVPESDALRLYCLMLDDASGEVMIVSCFLEGYGKDQVSRTTDSQDKQELIPSLTARYPAVHPFERELIEQFGVGYIDHPWAKPLRFAHDRADRSKQLNNYPFYSIRGEALHEVNVGPIHAGIIEPGCFRFICNGEQIIHLEIVLGFQHRGVERLIRETPNLLRQSLLCEGVAGDSAAAHGMAYAGVVESLHAVTGAEPVGIRLELERTIALEMERIALHLADTGALCMDIGFQLGQVSCEALRTIVINTTQRWCGNRFAKGLIRCGGTHYPLTSEIAALIRKNLDEVERRYAEVVYALENSSSVLARFEDCGVVTRAQAHRIGAVGMAARASGLERDLRRSHTGHVYGSLLVHDPVVETSGDVYARLKVRMREAVQSMGHVRTMLDLLENQSRVSCQPDYGMKLASDRLAFSLVEGWRGEICHVALTDPEGRVKAYKIVDPSVHNWTALALSVRGIGISDFPICNKSFNLSYCGHDL